MKSDIDGIARLESNSQVLACRRMLHLCIVHDIFTHLDCILYMNENTQMVCVYRMYTIYLLSHMHEISREEVQKHI